MYKSEIESGIGKPMKDMEKDIEVNEDKLYKDEEESEASEGEYITRTIFTRDRGNSIVRWTSQDPKHLKPIFLKEEPEKQKHLIGSSDFWGGKMQKLVEEKKK